MPLTVHNSTQPADELTAQAVHPAGSVFVSLLFWCSLVTAAAAYAAVALSPKFIAWIDARQRYRDNALHLQKLEQEVIYFERVADALRNDPEFASQIAQSSGTPAELTIAPPANNGSNASPADTAHLPANPDVSQVPLLSPRTLAIIRQLATQANLRTQLLCGAAALTLLAFTLFNEAGGWLVMATIAKCLRLTRTLLRRYTTQTPTSAVTAECSEVPAPDSNA